MADEEREGRILRTAGDPPTDYTRADLIATYFENTRNMSDDVFWAWQEVNDSADDLDLDDAWNLILDLVAAAPDPASIGTVAAGPLEDLLRAHAADLIDRLEAEATHNARLREALSGVWVYPDHVGQELSDRIYAAAEKDPGNWPVGESGLPVVAEQLLASDRILDRRWGAKQIGHTPYSESQKGLLLELLHSGDEDLRETAAQTIAYSRDPSLLAELIGEVNAHAGVGGGRQLAWSVNWLAQQADEEGKRQAHVALAAMAERGDEQTKRHVEELENPKLAVERFADMTGQLLALFEDQIARGGFSEESLVELREQQAKIEKVIEGFDERQRG